MTTMAKPWRTLRLAALLLIILGLVAAAWVIAGRVAVERANRPVELVMDYDELLNLARTQGYAVEPLLVGLRASGLTTVAVPEDTLQRLAADGRLGYWSGASLAAMARAGGPVDPALARLAEENRLRGDYTYVLPADQATAATVTAEFNRRVGQGVVSELRLTGNRALLEVKRQVGAAEAISLGPRPDDYRYLASLGFRVAPRLVNYPGATADDIRQELTALAGEGHASTVIFAGKEVLGYPANLEATARGLVDNRLTLGLIETPVQLSLVPQAGLEDLARLVGYRAARVYAISRKELDKISPAEMRDRWVRSAKERNIRVMYLRPFLVVPGQDLRQVNLDHVRSTREELALSGYRLGTAEGFREVHVPRWAQVLIVMGIAAGGWFLLLDLIALRFRTGLALLLLAVAGALFLAFAFPGARGGLGLQVMALASALIFPTIGTAYPLKQWLAVKGRPSLGVTVLLASVSILAATAISLVGAFFIASLLADIRYLLEFDYFRGVKLVHVVPMALVSLVYLAYYGAGEGAGRRAADVHGPPRDVIAEAARFLRTKVRAEHVAVLLLAAVVGYVYIGRTGHTAGVPVTSLELDVRAGLERLLVARPRTKEFLVGHPALIVAAWAALRGYSALVFPLILAGSIGQVSAVNSFEHLRTPFTLSLLRGVNGLVLGYAVGVAALFAVDPIARWLRERLGGGRRA